MQSACAILSSVASLALPYFSTLSYKERDFQGGKSYGTQCVLFLSETILILRILQSAVAINVHTSSFMGLVPLVYVRFAKALTIAEYTL